MLKPSIVTRKFFRENIDEIEFIDEKPFVVVDEGEFDADVQISCKSPLTALKRLIKAISEIFPNNEFKNYIESGKLDYKREGIAAYIFNGIYSDEETRKARGNACEVEILDDDLFYVRLRGEITA